MGSGISRLGLKNLVRLGGSIEALGLFEMGVGFDECLDSFSFITEL